MTLYSQENFLAKTLNEAFFDKDKTNLQTTGPLAYLINLFIESVTSYSHKSLYKTHAKRVFKSCNLSKE
jgi:hypothetical protein